MPVELVLVWAIILSAKEGSVGVNVTEDVGSKVLVLLGKLATDVDGVAPEAVGANVGDDVGAEVLVLFGKSTINAEGMVLLLLKQELQ